VDRTKLKAKIASQCVEAGVKFHYGRVDACQHEDGHSILKCQDGTQIKATIVVDATGHSRRLVEFDQEFDPGYQIAYGIMAGVLHSFFSTSLTRWHWD
jgi:lycopene beta-cyclase